MQERWLTWVGSICHNKHTYWGQVGVLLVFVGHHGPVEVTALHQGHPCYQRVRGNMLYLLNFHNVCSVRFIDSCVCYTVCTWLLMTFYLTMVLYVALSFERKSFITCFSICFYQNLHIYSKIMHLNMEYKTKNLCECGPSAPRTWGMLSWQHMAQWWCEFCSWHSGKNAHIVVVVTSCYISNKQTKKVCMCSAKSRIHSISPLRRRATSPYPSYSPTHWPTSRLRQETQKHISTHVCTQQLSVQKSTCWVH